MSCFIFITFEFAIAKFVSFLSSFYRICFLYIFQTGKTKLRKLKLFLLHFILIIFRHIRFQAGENTAQKILIFSAILLAGQICFYAAFVIWKRTGSYFILFFDSFYLYSSSLIIIFYNKFSVLRVRIIKWEQIVPIMTDKKLFQ